MSTLPTPIGPSPRQPVKNLFRGAFGTIASALRQFCERGFIRNGAPQKLRHTFFLHTFSCGRNTCFAKVLLRKHICCDLRKTLRDFHIIERENNTAVRIPNLGTPVDEFHRAIGARFYGRKFTINLHAVPASLFFTSPQVHAVGVVQLPVAQKALTHWCFRRTRTTQHIVAILLIYSNCSISERVANNLFVNSAEKNVDVAMIEYFEFAQNTRLKT